jgi:hypothetical protein
VTFASGVSQSITEAELKEYGITLLTSGTLQVFSDDLALDFYTFHLQISSTVVEEMTWFDTTYIMIAYQIPFVEVDTPNGAYFLTPLRN